MEKSDQNIRVIKKFGPITGKEMFRVKGDPNGWCNTVEEAVHQYHRCATWWDNYHKTGARK